MHGCDGSQLQLPLWLSNVISQHELVLPLILLSCLGSVLYLMLETYTGVVSTQTLLQREKEGLANIVQPHNMG